MTAMVATPAGRWIRSVGGGPSALCFMVAVALHLSVAIAFFHMPVEAPPPPVTLLVELVEMPGVTQDGGSVGATGEPPGSAGPGRPTRMQTDEFARASATPETPAPIAPTDPTPATHASADEPLTATREPDTPPPAGAPADPEAFRPEPQEEVQANVLAGVAATLLPPLPQPRPEPPLSAPEPATDPQTVPEPAVVTTANDTSPPNAQGDGIPSGQPGSPENGMADGVAGAPSDIAGDGTGDGLVGPGFADASLGNRPPSYPYRARQKGQEGRVLLLVTVDRAGLIVSLAVAETSGHRLLDEAALEAVSGWRFYPATRNDEPVAGTVMVPIVFDLGEE